MNRAAVAVALALAAGAAQALPADQIFERAAALTWQVRALGANEQLLGAASGIAVAPGKLLTSCAALARAQQVQLRRGNTIYDAKLEAPDVERDLCLLDAPGLAAPAPALGSSRTLRPGQRLYVIGYGVGSAVSIGEGLVSAVHDAGAANERIQTTIPAARGLLGAGVYDEQARLVGLVTHSPKEAAAVAFAVPADWVPEVAARGAAALAARSRPAPAGGGAAGTSAPGMPTAGTTWTYGHVERQFTRRQTEVSIQVLRVDGRIVEEAVTVAGGPSARRAMQGGELQFVEHPIGSGGTFLELEPYLLAANGGKPPADLGRAANYPPGGASLPGWIYRIAAHDWEQVSVPAGSFRALRIEVQGDRERPAFTNVLVTGRFRYTAWYAPDVRRYVRIEHQTWSGALANQGQQSGHEVIELLKYVPGS